MKNGDAVAISPYIPLPNPHEYPALLPMNLPIDRIQPILLSIHDACRDPISSRLHIDCPQGPKGVVLLALLLDTSLDRWEYNVVEVLHEIQDEWIRNRQLGIVLTYSLTILV